ncbi:hypothetical protein MRX96_004241 [Rhipicephalus microplus]
MPLLGDHRRPASRLARSVDPGGVRSGKLEKLVARTKSRFDVIGIPPTPAVRAPQQCFRPRLVLDSFRHCSDNNEETWSTRGARWRAEPAAASPGRAQ